MADKQRDIQGIGIEFGDWKLIPLDERNWELCHRHATADTAKTRNAGTVGAVRWHRLGKFYQWSTVGNAIRYAADCDLKEMVSDSTMDIREAMDEHLRTVETLVGGALASLTH